MKINQNVLRDICNNDCEEYLVIQKDFQVKTRWSLIWNVVFKYEDKFYSVNYNEPATEQQESDMFDHVDNEDNVKVYEVKPVDKTITVYESV